MRAPTDEGGMNPREPDTRRIVPESTATGLGDYAVIGDMRTAALVSKSGSIDWLCFPRFDSPAALCRLLDAGRGGFFEVRPSGASASERAYIDETNVLATTFTTASGRVRVVDFMDIGDGSVEGESTIVRIVEGLSGSVNVDVRLKPSFDFVRLPPRCTLSGGRLEASTNGYSMRLRCPAELHVGGDGTASTVVNVRASDRFAIVLSCATRQGRGDPDAPEEALRRTIAFWKTWAAKCTYGGPHRSLVLRSALTLKLLIYAPTGALVAAPTTSLPEQIGGVRNWDYRFTWLRDSSLVLDALMRLGYHEEAMAFWRFLESLCIGCCQELRIMYTATGEVPPAEETLEQLAGYAGSRPVRVGNAAAAQRQLDVYGNVIDAAHMCMECMGVSHPDLAPLLGYLADEAAACWREPDQGMWEVRTGPRHFLHSKLSCWIALDRAVRLAKRGWLPGDIGRWRLARSQLRRAILDHAYNTEVGAFTQSLDDDALDASALLVARSGLLPTDDPRVLSTIERVRERLTSHGLVYRYLNDDGLPGSEATFAICSFWMVDALVGAGRVDEARRLFEIVVSYANDVGLLAEEIDPISGGLLGNFPQAFSHLGLIRSALALNDVSAVP